MSRFGKFMGNTEKIVGCLELGDVGMMGNGNDY